MARLIAFLIIPAVLTMAAAPPESTAAEQETRQVVPPPSPPKMDSTTRSWRRIEQPGNAPASMPSQAAPMPAPPAQRGDSGRPDDTIGGSAGHRADEPGKQP